MVETALEHPELSSREVAHTLTDEQGIFISESSVYRILKHRGLITAPSHILISAANEFGDKTNFVHQMWQTDFTYFKIIVWGWYYLSTVIDDFSRYIVHWELCETMKAEDVQRTIDRAVKKAGLRKGQMPKLLCDNGSCYVAAELKDYLKENHDMNHHYYSPEELEAALEEFVNRYNNERYKNLITTTNSKHRFFKNPNRILDLEIKQSEQVWVSDITYVKLQNDYAYLALVTDAYSKKIVGFNIDNHMRTELVVNALKMALKERSFPDRKIIHHSDRGIQYCSPEFERYTLKNDIILSNTQNSDPYENAVAERMNKTLKYEYGLKETLPDLKTAQKMTQQAVNLYNNHRLHFSLNFQTPAKVHLKENVKYKSYKRKKILI